MSLIFFISIAEAASFTRAMRAMTQAPPGRVAFRHQHEMYGPQQGFRAPPPGSGLVQGLPDVDALWSAHVLAAGPQPAARAAVAVMVAVGAGSVLGGIAAVRRFRDPAPAVPPEAFSGSSPGA